jgi:hypothetical protein
MKQVDTRKPILIFMYSERIKSELIIASEILEKMFALKGEERKGAEKLMSSFLEALAGEIRIAQGIEKSINFLGAEKKIKEAIGKITLSEFSEINRCISDSLSYVATSSQKAMEILEEKHLL